MKQIIQWNSLIRIKPCRLSIVCRDVMTFFVMLSFSSTVLAMGTCQELFRPKIANKNISSESSFERAKADAARDGERTSERIKKYKGLTNIQLFEVAKISAAQNGGLTSLYIKNYEGLTNAQLFEVAKISAAKSGNWTSFYITNYKGLTNAQLFEVAKIAAAQNGWGTSDLIKNYGGLTNTQLFEVAKISAAQNGDGTSAYIKNYEGLTNTQLFEVAKIAVAQNSRGTSLNIKNYELTNTQLFEIVKISAAKSGLDTSLNIKNYEGLTNAQLFEVAKIAATQNARGTSALIKNYKGLTNFQLFEIAKIAAAQKRDGISENIKNYEGLTNVQLYEVAKIAIRSAQYLAAEVARRFSFIHEKARSLSLLAKVVSPLSEQIETDISEIHSFPKLKTYLSSFEDSSLLSQYPHIVHLAWDQIQKRETGLALIREALRLVVRKQPLPKTSFELLAKVSGLKLTLLPKNISNDTLGKIYELALEIQENLYGPFFGKINLPESIYKAPVDLINLLAIVRNLKSVRGNDREAALYVRRLLQNNPDIHQTMDLLKKDVVATIQKLLENKDIQFSYEDLASLQNAWGDLKPIFTLIARFNGNSKWKPLIPELSRIFSASLKDEFSQYKFKGDPKDQNDQEQARIQLSGLSEKAILEWQKPRTLIARAQEGKGFGEEELHHAAIKIFNDNLLQHLNLKKVIEEVQSLDGINDFILQQRLVPKEIYPLIVEKYALNGETKLNQQILISILKQFPSTNLKDIGKLVNFISFLFQKDPSLVEIVQKEEVERDLNSIKSLATSYANKAASPRALILTAISSDPKFLLTIGDIVNTASCQNYQTGSHIETLLGYVKDANVQAVVSFAITDVHFSNRTDYVKVQSAYRENQSVQVQFDGNQNVAMFMLANGEVISTENLGKAYLRQILKLGSNTKNQTPALYLEREYLQNHSNLLQMREQHQTLFQQLLDSTGATSKGPIQIEASRNRGGQYSDAAGGVKIQSYIIP